MEQTPRTYDTRALIVHNKFVKTTEGSHEQRTLIIHPNRGTDLTFRSQQSNFYDKDLRATLERESGVNMPKLATIRFLGAVSLDGAQESYGYALKPQCPKDVPRRDFSYSTHELDELLELTTQNPDHFDPVDAELLRRYHKHLTQTAMQSVAQ